MKYDEVREVMQQWVDDYNKTWPHYALGGLSPKMYKEKNIQAMPTHFHLLVRLREGMGTNIQRTVILHSLRSLFDYQQR